VTLFEVDSAALLARLPPSVDAEKIVRLGLGIDGVELDKEIARWAWPVALPNIDGVLVCYDANNEKSTLGLEELCGKGETILSSLGSLEGSRRLLNRLFWH
jgi:hypothetical protein